MGRYESLPRRGRSLAPVVPLGYARSAAHTGAREMRAELRDAISGFFAGLELPQDRTLTDTDRARVGRLADVSDFIRERRHGSEQNGAVGAVDERKTSLFQSCLDTRMEHVRHFQKRALVDEPKASTCRGRLRDDDVGRQPRVLVQGSRETSLP